MLNDESYTYDRLNRMAEAKSGGALVAAYAYDVNGNRQSLTYANGVTEQYTYNAANWVTKVSNKKGATLLSSFEYTYRADGNQASKLDDTDRLTSYVYDGMGRLLEEKESVGGTEQNAITYAYDASGNRASMGVSGEEDYAEVYSYDLNDRLTGSVKTAGDTVVTTLYEYDPNGNQVSKKTGELAPAGAESESLSFNSDGVQLSEYDASNRIRSKQLKREGICFACVKKHPFPFHLSPPSRYADFFSMIFRFRTFLKPVASAI